MFAQVRNKVVKSPHIFHPIKELMKCIKNASSQRPDQLSLSFVLFFVVLLWKQNQFCARDVLVDRGWEIVRRR